MKTICFLTTLSLSLQSVTFSAVFLYRRCYHSRILENTYFGDDEKENGDNNLDIGMNFYSDFYTYFVDLDSNFGNNSETQATCGYVALAMLFTYYDTYLNDSIVPESYDVCGDSSSSPGTLYEDNSGLPNNSVAGYYSYLRNNYLNSSLHAYFILLNMGAIEANPSPMQSTYLEEFGTTQPVLAALASNYLNLRNLSTSCTVFSKSTVDPNETKQTIIASIENEIDNGYPVVCGFDGHARVVYGYSDTHKFYYHNGYLGQSSSSKLIGSDGSGLQNDSIGFVSLHFSLSHSHAFNYVTSDGTHYCRCGAYPHVHDYTYNYVYVNTNYHWSYCSCGAHIQQRHTYRINLNHEYCPCGSSLWD